MSRITLPYSIWPDEILHGNRLATMTVIRKSNYFGMNVLQPLPKMLIVEIALATVQNRWQLHLWRIIDLVARH